MLPLHTGCSCAPDNTGCCCRRGGVLCGVATIRVTAPQQNMVRLDSPFVTIERDNAAWVLAGATALWACWLLVGASDGGLALPVAAAASGGTLLLGAVGVTRAARTAWRARRLRAPLRTTVPVPVCVQLAGLAVCMLALSTDIAFGARVLLSQRALERAAHAAQRGRVPHQPQRIGLFVVREMDVVGSAVRFVTTDCGLDECGVAFSAQGEPPRHGEDRYVHLRGAWWRWHRSW